MPLWIPPVIAFLAGSIPFGLLIAKAKGINIREHGSGNIGATNVLRVIGKSYGIGCLVLDLLKGQKDERIAKLEVAREIIRKSGGFEYAEEMAEKLVATGIASLAQFDTGQNRETLGILTGLAKYVISRDK